MIRDRARYILKEREPFVQSNNNYNINNTDNADNTDNNNSCNNNNQ